MVRREPDGHTLYWIQDGLKVEVNYMEQQFGITQQVQDAQIANASINRQSVGNYLNSLANAQISVSAGRPVDIPTPPKMIITPDPIMDDWGWVTAPAQMEVDWVPALPTVVYPKTTPTQVNK